MTLGIDLSSLQGAHRMRGIGYTLLNLINNLSLEDRKRHSFVFFLHPGDDDPLALLDVSGMDYSVRPLKVRNRISRRLPGRLNLFVSAFNQLVELKDLHLGDSRIGDLSGIDFFLQTDQSQPLPRRRWGMKRGLIIYDIIPYVLEWEYLWSFKTARRHGFSRKAALRVYSRRWLYAHKIKTSSRRANILLSISNHTKKDFISHMGVSGKKIAVTPLGINLPAENRQPKVSLGRYLKTSWGYVRHPFSFEANTPFILYVGGADRRKRIDDLVAAFNLLRAQGHEFKLVLAGDSMQGPDNIATEEIQHALKTSSYAYDIVYMGFVDDDIRDWLYSQTRAFVFPSRYEGYGLPVLEAMSYGAPVISYKNAATLEVAGDRPQYVDNMLELADAIAASLATNTRDLARQRTHNIAQAKKWTWESTAKAILKTITE